MGTTSDKLIYLNETKTQLKDMINYGLDTNEKITNATTFRNYVKSLFDAFIKTMTYPEVLYDNLPKVTGESTSLTLNNTVHAPMSISLKGNTSQKTNLLPSDYTEVDYIESHANEYIDTGLVLGSNFNIELAFALTQYRNAEQPIISTWNNTNGYFNLFIRPSNANPGANSLDLYVKAHHYTGTSALTLNNIVNINITRNGNDWSTVQDGNETSFQSTNLTDNNLTLKIFKRGDINNACYARVYKLKIYNNDVLVRDFIPCYRNSDNEIGLYDLVNNVFYTNQGTGAFTYGITYNRQTPSPDYPQNVNVVSGNNEIEIIGKNLLDISAITNITGVTNNGDGTITFNGNFANTSYLLEKPFVLNANTTYTLSLTNTYTSSGSATFILRNGDTNIMALNYANKSISYTPTIDTTIDTIRLFNAGITFNNYTFSVQLEKSSTATEYTKYESQTYSINLGNIELYKIGDYQDYLYKENGKWYLEKSIQKIQLTGNENWVYYTNIGLPYFIYTNAYIEQIKKSINAPVIVCNSFANQGKAYSPSAEGIFFNATSNGSINGNLSIYEEDFASADDLKSFLQENETIFYYPLSTPTITEITDTTLITQLDNLEKVYSYDEQTNITQTNNDLPFIISAKAILDLRNVVNV